MTKQKLINPLTEDEQKILKQCVVNTWSVICNDIEENGEVESNIVALECVFDANYMMHYGGRNGKLGEQLFDKIQAANGGNHNLAYKVVDSFVRLV